jgi:hypothetical protein
MDCAQDIALCESALFGTDTEAAPWTDAAGDYDVVVEGPEVVRRAVDRRTGETVVLKTCQAAEAAIHVR